jgi:hypothetical protein
MYLLESQAVKEIKGENEAFKTGPRKPPRDNSNSPATTIRMIAVCKALGDRFFIISFQDDVTALIL